MERATGQTRTGQAATSSKTGAAGTVVEFTCPVSKVVLQTIKPDFANVAAFINIIMEEWSNSDQLTGNDAAVFQATISGKLLDYFTRYCVRITEAQRVPGLKAVAQAYKEAGIKKMPKGKELIGKMVLIAFAPAQEDRRALLAHFCQLSGLVNFMTPENQAYTRKALEA